VAIDLSRFAGAFFEECFEHLSAMERLLVDLDMGRPDPESLNAIFRAAHSVKGGAGIFGFQSLAELTHVLESLLDRMRKGEIAPSKRMVDLVLSTCDVMRTHVSKLQGGGTPDDEAAARAKRLLEVFAENPDAANAEGGGAGTKRYRVRIALDRASFPDESSVDRLLEDIGGAGRIALISKGIDEGGGESRLAFDIETSVEMDEFRDSLEFLVSAESIEIETAEEAAPRAEAPKPEEHDLPKSTDAPAGATVGVTAEEPVGATDEAYGFFDPLPTKPLTELAAPAPTEPAPAPVSDARLPSDRRSGVDRRTGADRRAESEGVGAGVLDGSSIRINVEKVDQLVNLVGELVIAQSMVSQAARGLENGEDAGLLNGLGQLERNTRDLQEAVMAIRMLPIGFVFNRFPRVVRDLAERFGKRVRLEMSGEETELDKGLIERIADPLTHLVRNALDHGIELPQERTKKGKPAEGVLSLSASHQAGAIIITVTDDGAGIDRDKIIAKGRLLGFPVSEDMSDQELFQLIFAPGFTTATSVTDVSGRGVGMDVVKRNVSALGGRIEIESAPETGTSIKVRLPLTLAIIDGMSVRVRDQIYIVPLAQIAESLQPSQDQLKSVNGREVVDVRSEYLPVISLAGFLGIHSDTEDDAQSVLVVLETERGRTAVRVDELVGQQQVVLKSLEANYRKVHGISGATIMGDGRVAFILDVSAIVGATDASRSQSAEPIA